MNIKKFEDFNIEDIYLEMESGFCIEKHEVNHTLIIQLFNGDIDLLTKSYCKYFNYDRVVVKDLEELFNGITIDYESIIIVDSFNSLDYQNLTKVVGWSCEKNISVGLIVGNEKDIAYQMYKSIKYSKNLEIVNKRMVLTPKYTDIQMGNLTISSVYSPIVNKHFFSKQKIFTGIFGGGRIDQLSIGSRLVLTAENKDESTLQPDNLNTEFLMINGCVLGNTSPKKFERKGRNILSRDILRSNIVGYIAPFATKLSDEEELEISQAIFESGFSIGMTALYSNLYCISHNLSPVYAYYGDPNHIEKRLDNNYCVKKIKKESKLMTSKTKYFYFDTNIGEEIVVTRKSTGNLIDKIELIDFNYNQTIYDISRFKKNIKANQSISKLLPNTNEFKKILVKNQELYYNLEKNFYLLGSNTAHNKDIVNKISNIQKSNELLTDNIMDYWEKNIAKDKYRLYDLHFGYNQRSEVQKKYVCPVCNDYEVSEILSIDYFDSYSRYIKICPSCSIIDDQADKTLDLKVVQSSLIDDMVEVDVNMFNNSNFKICVTASLCVRGMKTVKQVENERYEIEPHSYIEVNLKRKFKQSDLLKDIVYATILCLVNGGIYLFKRQFYV
ncbi:hypothetical protein [Enterococcus sp. DIV1420a]|uniref:hypothetical protein n=1 Tax=Enterococcus sp. DIV1420a TaxID=2774672 RepID=UPI003F26D824